MGLYRRRPLKIEPNLDGPRLRISESVVDSLAEYLPKEVRGQGHENVAYIVGYFEGHSAVGLSVILPRAQTAPRSYDTDPESHMEVMQALAELDLAVVAQIHSHPGPNVEHSGADDDLAFVCGEGFWSLVVPNYARQLPDLKTWGVHLYQDGEFWLLSDSAAQSRVSIIPKISDLRSSESRR